MDTQKRYWFPAKQYGWGWSFPTCWQGWAVLVAYVASLILLHYFFPPASAHAWYLAGLGLLTFVFLGICWLKGEPPGSR
jgi:lipoprotein signal peptidase